MVLGAVHKFRQKDSQFLCKRNEYLRVRLKKILEKEIKKITLK